MFEQVARWWRLACHRANGAVAPAGGIHDTIVTTTTCATHLASTLHGTDTTREAHYRAPHCPHGTWWAGLVHCRLQRGNRGPRRFHGGQPRRTGRPRRSQRRRHRPLFSGSSCHFKNCSTFAMSMTRLTCRPSGPCWPIATRPTLSRRLQASLALASWRRAFSSRPPAFPSSPPSSTTRSSSAACLLAQGW